MSIDLPHYKYPTATEQTLFYRQLLDRAQNLPGVQAAGIEQPGSTVFFRPEGQPPAPPGQEPTADLNVVSPADFSAMGIALVSGREFSRSDREGAAPVAVISEIVARRYWPHANPLGRHLTLLVASLFRRERRYRTLAGNRWSGKGPSRIRFVGAPRRYLRPLRAAPRLLGLPGRTDFRGAHDRGSLHPRRSTGPRSGTASE